MSKCKVYNIDIEPVYPVGSCMIVVAENKKQARGIAEKERFGVQDIHSITEIKTDSPHLELYLSGDY